MSYRLTILTTTPNTYRFADRTQDTAGATWHGRLLVTPELEKLGNSPVHQDQVRRISFQIRNNDLLIPITEDLWGAAVILAIDRATSTVTWYGFIKRYDHDGALSLNIDATEDQAKNLTRLIPDEVVRLITYSDAGSSAVNQVIPTVFGGTATDPIPVVGILVDRTTFRFLLCAGKIRQIVTLYLDRQPVTEGFTVYLGAVDQVLYPGLAYVEFDEDPRDETGRWPEIHAEVVGLELGESTEDECRNPARVLLYLLSTAASGPGGWGLGIPESDIDLVAFGTAIDDCQTLGVKLDGAFYFQQTARQWIEAIRLVCRGRFQKTSSDKWALFVDKEKTVSLTFDSRNMRLERLGKGELSARYNRIALSYRYNPIPEKFFGFVERQDVPSQAKIGYQELELTGHLIRDHPTAGLVADYHRNFQRDSELQIRFQTNIDLSDINVDSAIEIDRPDLGLSEALFRVTRLVPRDFVSIVEARSYSDDTYDISTPEEVDDPYIDPVIPGLDLRPPDPPTDLSLTTTAWIAADGTLVAGIYGAFTPGARTQYVEVLYGEGEYPPSWTKASLASETGFSILSLKPGEWYVIRIVPYNAGGPGEALEDAIETSVKDVPPGNIVTLIATQRETNKTLVDLAWSTVNEPDISGYELRYGPVGTIWAAAAKIHDGLVTLAQFTHILAASASLTFLAKARDRSGQYSETAAVANLTATVEPPDVTRFVAIQNGFEIILAWGAVSTKDLKGYEIREGPDFGSGLLIASGLTGTAATTHAQAEGLRTFHIKAVSTEGNYSLNGKTASINVSGLPPVNVLQQYDEMSLQDGEHDDTQFSASVFRADTIGGRASDWPATRASDFPSGTVLRLVDGVLTGTYTCAARDLGETINAHIMIPFRGITDFSAGATILLEFRTGFDGLTWSDWAEFFPTSLVFQFVQFRVTLTRLDPSGTPCVSLFAPIVDVPDVDKVGKSVAVAIGGTAIEFGHEYHNPPSVVATAIGEIVWAEIVPDSITKEQATIKVRNVYGDDVGGLINWFARGF